MFDKPDNFEGSERTHQKVVSDIPSFDEDNKEIEITLENGEPKALAFFDIDGTLGDFQDIHGECTSSLYPDHDPEEVIRELQKGSSLGTTYRVHDRMIKIFDEGRDEFRDPKVYMTWFAEHQAEVDESGPAHDKAAEYSMKHSKSAAKMVEELYQKDPSSFEDSKILPVLHLAKLYQRMGIPLAILTANDEPFARAISKCLGLADSFITMASQKDFEGSGKDKAIEVLIQKMEEKGISIPKKLIIVGDSLGGDVGSGASFQRDHAEFDVEGVFVVAGDVEEAKRTVNSDPSLQNISVEVLDPSKVTLDSAGQPELAKYRKKYGTKPKTE